VIEAPIRDMQAEYKVTKDLMFVFFRSLIEREEKMSEAIVKEKKIIQTFRKKHSFFYLCRSM